MINELYFFFLLEVEVYFGLSCDCLVAVVQNVCYVWCRVRLSSIVWLVFCCLIVYFSLHFLICSCWESAAPRGVQQAHWEQGVSANKLVTSFMHPIIWCHSPFTPLNKCLAHQCISPSHFSLHIRCIRTVCSYLLSCATPCICLAFRIFTTCPCTINPHNSTLPGDELQCTRKVYILLIAPSYYPVPGDALWNSAQARAPSAAPPVNIVYKNFSLLAHSWGHIAPVIQFCIPLQHQLFCSPQPTTL